MADVYRIVTAEGHEYDFHGGVEALQDAHPGAAITGRRVVNAVGEGTYEPYTIEKAQAAERKTAASETATTKVSPAAEAPARGAKPEAAKSDAGEATP